MMFFPVTLLLQVKMLEKLINAVHSVEHRKAAFGRKANEQQPSHTRISDVAQVRCLHGLLCFYCSHTCELHYVAMRQC